jgi:hypothetical protein
MEETTKITLAVLSAIAGRILDWLMADWRYNGIYFSPSFNKTFNIWQNYRE